MNQDTCPQYILGTSMFSTCRHASIPVRSLPVRRRRYIDLSPSVSSRTSCSMEIGVIELSLSLSLNGRFGSDPPRIKDKVVRSSSSLLLEVPEDDEAEECGRGLTAQMERSYSLPTMHASKEEEEEGRKKRKEMQSLKRMEVKRRRMEKQRITKGVNLRGTGTTGVRFRRRTRETESGWSRSGIRRRGGSSWVSSESNSPEEKQRRSLPSVSPPIRRKGTVDSKSAEQMSRTVLEDMPCVCAKVDSPNVGKVEGFLFRYRKGEGIKIVCMCHGKFLSPAEFVEHAGGGDITNPLKHIIVCPPSW